MKFYPLFLVFTFNLIFSQPSTVTDSLIIQNGNQRILEHLSGIPSGITLGGYAEMTYNQELFSVGKLDVKRLVMLFGYKFDDRTQFVTEIEFEHVSQVFVEQAFLNYTLADGINLRGGLMLVPMGIINEYHEPTTFNGVERPGIDYSLIPTTWRELGIGISGRLDLLSLRYQAYLFNGFLSYTDERGGILSGKNALRSGRQKGIQSVMNSPTFSAKVDYYGVPGLRLGFAYYGGPTQSVTSKDFIEGSVVGINMFGLDARLRLNKFSSRAQGLVASLSNTFNYNTINNQDLGSRLSGYYLEMAYNVLPTESKQRLDTFVRYEDFNTHSKVVAPRLENPLYHRKEWTFGFSYHLSQGTVVKTDYQRKTTAQNIDPYGQWNVGIGVWF